MTGILKLAFSLLFSVLTVTAVYSQSNNQSDKAEFIFLKGDGVFPESIITLPNKDLLVSCIGDGSIQRIDSKNIITYFNNPHENGILSALGMAIDKKRNQLWVINLNLKMANGYPGSNLKVFDLSSGKLIKTISEDYVPGSFFNDLTIDESGRVYISNTVGPNIWTATIDSKEAEVFVKSDLLENPDPDQPLDQNGIAITPDHNYIIVSVMHRFMGGKGRLVRINIASKEVTNVSLNDGEAVKAFAGADGMFFYNKQLLMVNVFPKAAVIMTATFNQDYSVATLAIKNKSQSIYDRPTSSAIRNGKLYTVNSQLNHIVDDKDGKLNTPPVTPFKVVSVPLTALLK
jgi:sugar lactone lactonase YvrE